MNLNSSDIFNYLSHEILTNGNFCYRCKHKEQNKQISIDLNDNEIALFFLIDGHYIKDADSHKADVLVYYCEHVNSSKANDKLLLIELKGIKVDDAINQLEDTIKHRKFHTFWNKFKGDKYAGVVTNSSAPKNKRDMQRHFLKTYNTYLNIISQRNVNLRKFF